jgi:hypothetical protein
VIQPARSRSLRSKIAEEILLVAEVVVEHPLVDPRPASVRHPGSREAVRGELASAAARMRSRVRWGRGRACWRALGAATVGMISGPIVTVWILWSTPSPGKGRAAGYRCRKVPGGGARAAANSEPVIATPAPGAGSATDVGPSPTPISSSPSAPGGRASPVKVTAWSRSRRWAPKWAKWGGANP